MSSLNLKAVGDFSLILQKFKHKQHKLFCVIKVFRRQNMYNWLSYIDMMQIEAELMRLCEDIDWKDLESIANFSTELHIESNIKLRIKAANCLASSVMTLMEDTIKPTRDIVLQIEVKHLPMDDKGAAKPQAVELQNSTKARVCKTKKKKFESNNTELNSPKMNLKRSAATSRPARSRAKRMRLKDFVLKDNKRSSNENRECDQRKSYPMPPLKDNKRSSKGNRECDQRKLYPMSPLKDNKRSSNENRECDQPKLFAVSPLKDNKRSSNENRKCDQPKLFAMSPLKDNKRSSNEDRECDQPKLFAMPAGLDGDDSEPNGEESSLGTYALSAVGVKPPEVEILTLPLTEEEILSSFEKYRIYFDKYFEETKHRTRGAFSYEGLGFIDVADLISLDTRRNMGEKLRKNYVKDGFTPHVPICIDGLLPLWTIRLFMDYHKLEHDAAVEHIKAQNMLNLYETVHGDKPLASDIEDW